MRATVVIPNLNARDLLAAALESFAGQTVPAHVVVVDNASTDGAADMVTARFPDVTLIRNSENEGFGRAVNRGAEEADGDVVIVTNNDVIARPDFVERLLEPFADPAVGMVAGVLTQKNAPDRIDSAGIELDVTLGAWDYLMNMPVTALSPETPAPALPCGGAAAYRIDCWRAAGGFDDQLFAYSEDVDLGLAIRSAGWRCAIAPEARAEHHHGATTGASSPFQRRLHAFGRGYVLGKHRVLESGPVMRLRVAALDWPTLLVHLVARRERDPISERRRGLRAGRARSGARVPTDVTTLTFGEAMRRQAAWFASRFTGRRPAHFQA